MCVTYIATLDNIILLDIDVNRHKKSVDITRQNVNLEDSLTQLIKFYIKTIMYSKTMNMIKITA